MGQEGVWRLGGVVDVKHTAVAGVTPSPSAPPVRVQAGCMQKAAGEHAECAATFDNLGIYTCDSTVTPAACARRRCWLLNPADGNVNDQCPIRLLAASENVALRM